MGVAINQALSKLASVMGNPKSQKPTLDQRYTHLSLELQNMYNELTNSHQPWTENEVTINITNGTQDYIIPRDIGTILFAYATPVNNLFGPIGLEISDLANVSSDFFLYNPLDFGITRDFNEALVTPFIGQIAFYRTSAGTPYLRLPPFSTSMASVTLVYATGNWVEDLDPSATPIMSQYIMLPIVRAAQNLMPDAEWPDGKDRAATKVATLQQIEKRYMQQFVIAKRSFDGDTQETYRVPFGGEY